MIFDIIIVIVLLIGIFSGYKRGLIVEVLGITSIFIAGYVAYYFSEPVANWFTWSFSFKKELFFVLVFVAVMLGVGFFAQILSRLFQAAGLGVMDGIGGAFISLCKYLVITALVFTMILSINDKTGWIKQQHIESSSLIRPTTKISEYLFPYLRMAKDELNEFKKEYFQ